MPLLFFLTRELGACAGLYGRRKDMFSQEKASIELWDAAVTSTETNVPNLPRLMGFWAMVSWFPRFIKP